MRVLTMSSICTCWAQVAYAQPGKAVPLAQERDLAQRYAFESHQHAGGS